MQDINTVARQVSESVAHGLRVGVRPPARVAARELTIEFEADPYPEVPAAFAEFCRMTSVSGRLGKYEVRPVPDEAGVRAEVTATIRVGDAARVGSAVDDDVVTASVRAFAAAVGV